MTKQANPSDGMKEGLSPRCYRAVVVRPPFVVDTQLGVTAVDVSLSGSLPTPTSGLVALCLGGHPPAECLLEATGSGPDHQIVVAIDETQPGHHQFAVRLRGMFKPEEPIHVIPLPHKTTRYAASAAAPYVWGADGI
jgi:hypothetical protein